MYENDGSKTIMRSVAYNGVKTENISEYLQKNIKVEPWKETINRDPFQSRTKQTKDPQKQK